MKARDARKVSSFRQARPFLMAAFLTLITGLALLSGLSSSAGSHWPDAPKVATEVSDANAIPGDLDCDANIDIVDALLILRRVASLPPVFGCGASDIASDVNCSGATDAVDALAILREMARLSALSIPDGCPGLDHEKVTPFVEIERLSCEPAAVDRDEGTDCYYSVSSSGADHELSWDFGGGVATGARPAVLGLSCPPNGLPCTFASAGTQSVTFQTPGDKIITLTACAMGSCDSRAGSVAVAAASAPSGAD